MLLLSQYMYILCYQAKQDETLITSFRKEKQVYKYHVTGTMDGACMATLKVRFFDDLRGTTPKITTFPTHASKETPDMTVSKVTKGTL